MEKLNKDRIKQLIRESDTAWFNKNPHSLWTYREHLNFTADYIVKNYNRTQKKGS